MRANVGQVTLPALLEAFVEAGGGTAGWTGVRAARGGGCGAAGPQSACPAALKQPVPFLSHPSPALPPAPPLEPHEGLALGCFLRCLAGPEVLEVL